MSLFTSFFSSCISLGAVPYGLKLSHQRPAIPFREARLVFVRSNGFVDTLLASARSSSLLVFLLTPNIGGGGGTTDGGRLVLGTASPDNGPGDPVLGPPGIAPDDGGAPATAALALGLDSLRSILSLHTARRRRRACGVVVVGGAVVRSVLWAA